MARWSVNGAARLARAPGEWPICAAFWMWKRDRNCRIAKYDANRAEEDILRIESGIAKVRHNLSRMTEFTIDFFKDLKAKHGKTKERRTEIVALNSIVATQVAIANEKLYVNRAEGFIGYGLKDQELIGNCSTIDEVIAFLRDGTMKVNTVEAKEFYGKDITHAAIFVKNDENTTYNLIYEDGETGIAFVKRFTVSGIIKDKAYCLTQETPGSKVLYFSAHPNDEAEKIKYELAAGPGMRKLDFEFDFASLAVKARTAQGNTLSKHKIKKIKVIA